MTVDILTLNPYTLSAVLADDERPTRLPLATAVLGNYGWSINSRTGGQFRQALYPTRDEAAVALRAVAHRRAVVR